MKTHRITKLHLDAQRLAADISKACEFPNNGSYSEFVCGRQRICMLYNRSGSLEETHISQYETPAMPTKYGEELPYICGMIEAAFDLTSLRFARLIHLLPNSVVIPHRDYLELEKKFCRIHVPLRTDSSCYLGEGDVVFRMRAGEVWYLDATNVHSAAALSTEVRTHLILDFAETDDVGKLLKVSYDRDGSIPPENIVERAPMTLEDERAILSLSALIDLDNYRDLLSLLVKKYYRKQVPASKVFEWFTAIGELSGNPALMETIERQKEYYLLMRRADSQVHSPTANQ